MPRSEGGSATDQPTTDQPTETDRGLDAGVLGGMYPRGHEHRRTGDPSRDRDVRPRVLRETLIAGEREMIRDALAGGRDRDRADRALRRVHH